MVFAGDILDIIVLGLLNEASWDLGWKYIVHSPIFWAVGRYEHHCCGCLQDRILQVLSVELRGAMINIKAYILTFFTTCH